MRSSADEDAALGADAHNANPSRKRPRSRSFKSKITPGKKRLRPAAGSARSSGRPVRRMRKYSTRPGWLDDFAMEDDGAKDSSTGNKKTTSVPAAGKWPKKTKTKPKSKVVHTRGRQSRSKSVNQKSRVQPNRGSGKIKGNKAAKSKPNTRGKAKKLQKTKGQRG